MQVQDPALLTSILVVSAHDLDLAPLPPVTLHQLHQQCTHCQRHCWDSRKLAVITKCYKHTQINPLVVTIEVNKARQRCNVTPFNPTGESLYT